MLSEFTHWFGWPSNSFVQYWLNNNGTNEEFWEHEYNKHGICISTLEPQCFKKTAREPFPELTTYVTKTIELYQVSSSYTELRRVYNIRIGVAGTSYVQMAQIQGHRTQHYCNVQSDTNPGRALC
jgi:hypothetical protein